MWIAFSAIAWSAIGRWKLMTIGLATPTVAPLTGLNDGGRNGGSPTNGVGSWPATGPAGAAAAAIGADGGAAGAAGGGAATGSTTVGSPGGWSGSARAGPGPQASTAASPAVLRTARSVPLVDRDICIPPVTVCSPVWHSTARGFRLGERRPVAQLPQLAS